MSFEPDLDLANEVWHSTPRLESVEDLYSVTVEFGAPPRKAATHLFGDSIRIIPYDLPRSDDAEFPHEAVPRGAEDIARYFRPGDIGFAIKHRRTENRMLSARQFANTDELTKEFKQHVKLQDLHVAAVFGVEERTQRAELHPTVVVVSNPDSYEKELFYQRDYPMVFVRPKFADWLAEYRGAFLNNMRTMLVCFNIVTEYPDNYDDQPLAARSPEAVGELVGMMIRAVAGDPTAADFFRLEANWVYCGELIHLAASAALLFPLNQTTCEPMVNKSTWSRFVQAITQHNRGAPEALARTKSNAADLLKIHLDLAPENLQPMVECAPPHLRPQLRGRLAFQPMTVFDVVEQFVKLHWPRERLGELLAAPQARVVELLVPAFKTWTRATLEKLTETQHAEVDLSVMEIVSTVRTTYDTRADFEESLNRVRDEAEHFMAANELQHLTTPPSMFHLIANGRHTGGLLGVEYVGHGLHRSLVRPSG